MTETISFIHAADLHLDSPFKGLSQLPEQIFKEVSESTFQSLHQIIDLAISKQVDFIIFVGDLFDHERQSLKAQIRLRTAFQKLKEYHINVYLSYGNHDFINGNVHAVEYPDNVYIFSGQEVESFTYSKNDHTSVSISGFSYENRVVKEEKILEYPVRNQAATYHIGMLHGSVYGNNEHDTYAPFKIKQLLDKQYDYWALGHIHKRQTLNNDPPIVYPGNIQSRHRNEQGEKGCYLVELHRHTAKTSFYSTQQIQFLHLDVELSENQTLAETESYIWEKLQTLRGKYLISLTWIAKSEHWIMEHNNGWLDDLISSLNERLYTEDEWNYIYKHNLTLIKQVTPEYNTQFLAEMDQAFSEMNIANELKELTSHKKGRRFLEPPEESWKEEAKQYLYAALFHTKRDG